MQPIEFPGAVEIKKPANMTDEECMSVWATYGFTALIGFKKIPPAVYTQHDQDGYRVFLTAWKPSYEDLQALNRGEPIYIKTLATGLPPMAVYTLDEDGNSNDAG